MFPLIVFHDSFIYCIYSFISPAFSQKEVKFDVFTVRSTNSHTITNQKLYFYLSSLDDKMRTHAQIETEAQK